MEIEALSNKDISFVTDVYVPEKIAKKLGDEKLTYLGYSYGTRIGAGYAEAYPDKMCQPRGCSGLGSNSGWCL